MRSVALSLLLLFGCSKDKGADQSNVVAPRAFADVQLTLGEGWGSTYDAATDTRHLVGPGGTEVQLQQADERFVASPDAYMNHLSPRWKGKLVTIEDRASVRSSGFALKLGVYTGENDPAPLHVTVVVGKLGRIWYHCIGEAIEDDAIHQQVIAMCRSVRN